MLKRPPSLRVLLLPAATAIGLVAGLAFRAGASPSAMPDGDPNACEVYFTPCARLGVGETFTFVAEGLPPGGTYLWSVTQSGEQLAPTGGSGPEFTVMAQEASESLNDVLVSVTYTAPGGAQCSTEASLTVVQFTIKSVSFDGTAFHAVTKDCRAGVCEPYETPHWLDLNRDGDAVDPDEHQSPAAFTRNSTIVLTNVRFDTRPIDLGQNVVFIRGVGPDAQVFEGWGGMAAGEVFVYGDLTAAAPLPNTVRVYDSYDIDWQIALTNFELYSAGTSRNCVYVTLAAPLGRRLESFFDIGTRAADGQETLEDVVDAIWADFADLHVVNARDEVMGYYRGILCASDCTIYDAQGLVVELNGQCGAWRDLMIQCLRTQGIGGAQYVTVEPISDYGILVNDYQFAAGGGTSGCPGYPYKFDSPCGGPYWPGGPEVTDLDGLPGQDEPNPASYFARHFIVKLNGAYYDPSYGAGPFEGTTFEANLIWEQSAMAGYHGTCGGYHAAREDVFDTRETRFDQ